MKLAFIFGCWARAYHPSVNIDYNQSVTSSASGILYYHLANEHDKITSQLALLQLSIAL